MRWLAAGLVLLVAACGGGKATNNGSGAANASLSQSRLTQAETRAAGFTKSGDYQNAARQYAEALRIATTLENADAIARNAINLIAATVDAGFGVVEHAIFGPDLVDSRAPTHGIVLTEDVLKIAGQQGRYAIRHGVSRDR